MQKLKNNIEVSHFLEVKIYKLEITLMLMPLIFHMGLTHCIHFFEVVINFHIFKSSLNVNLIIGNSNWEVIYFVNRNIIG